MNPFQNYWMEGDSLAPPCQAEMDVVDHILEASGVSYADHLIDLGCGDGRIALRAASRFGCTSTGVELESTLCATFNRYIALGKFGDRVTCIEGDLREVDVTSATIVITYLLPNAMAEISDTLIQVLARGGTVVCNTWGIVKLDEDGRVKSIKSTIGNTNVFVYKDHDGLLTNDESEKT